MRAYVRACICECLCFGVTEFSIYEREMFILTDAVTRLTPLEDGLIFVNLVLVLVYGFTINDMGKRVPPLISGP